MTMLRVIARRGLVVGLLAGLGTGPAVGCKSKDEDSAQQTEQRQAPEPDAAEPSPPDPEPDPDPCPDLSGLDVDALPPLPEGRHVAVLDKVWRHVLDKHYDPTLGCVDWVALRAEYGRKVARAGSRGEAYRLIDEMLGKLEQSHFRLFPPDTDEAAAVRGAYSPPLELRWIDDQLLVIDSAEGPSRVPPGSVVVRIGKTPVEKLAENAEPTRASSDPPIDRGRVIVRRAENKLSCRRLGQTRELTVLDPTRDDKSVDYTVTCEEPEGELVTFGNLTNVPTRVEHRMIEGTSIGYLAFNVWMLPMKARVKAALDDLDAKKMQALIIDLRGNPGGVGAMTVPIARWLLPKGGELGRLRFRNFAQTFRVEPLEDAFAGPLVLLIDETTASTSEIFAAGLRDLGRVTIVGASPSAGTALPSLIEELPGGAILQYVVGDYHSPKGTAVEGRGIIPDIKVDESRQDFVTGRDPVLEAAIEHLQRS